MLAGASIGMTFTTGAVAACASILWLHRQQKLAFARADCSRIDPQMPRQAR